MKLPQGFLQSLDPRRFIGIYQVVCWSILISIVLHAISPITSVFHIEGGKLFSLGLFWVGIYILLTKQRRFAAYLGFMFGLIGCISALSGTVDPQSFVPSWNYTGILFANTCTVVCLFMLLWQPKRDYSVST